MPQDMIAVPLTGKIRQLVTATPDYFARHGTPQTPDDLLSHQGIGMRMAHGGIYRWELARRGKRTPLPYRRALRHPIFSPRSAP